MKEKEEEEEKEESAVVVVEMHVCWQSAYTSCGSDEICRPLCGTPTLVAATPTDSRHRRYHPPLCRGFYMHHARGKPEKAKGSLERLRAASSIELQQPRQKGEKRAPGVASSISVAVAVTAFFCSST